MKRSVHRLLDRSLHSGRRNRARSELRSVSGVETVLFLCLGNVCRSPYAEARFRARMSGTVRTGSAGFIGPGRPPPSHAIEAARARGLDTSEHRSRLVTPDLLAESDVIVVMDSRQRRRVRRLLSGGSTPVVILGDLDPDVIPNRTIRDPWGRGSEVFAAVFDRIDRCIEELSANLVRSTDPPMPHPPGGDLQGTENGTRPWASTTSR